MKYQSAKNLDAIIIELRQEEEQLIKLIETFGGDMDAPPSPDQAERYQRVFAIQRVRRPLEEALMQARCGDVIDPDLKLAETT